ncbi:MAG: dUTP diphosphatase [Rickettsiales bacterium]|jgi:dUTP pyrophosphatase|nr:dUTP diphosphatase [Rickettsiales bacterium]
MKIKFKKLDQRAIVPCYETLGASGMDLHVLVDNSGEEVLKSYEIKLFRTAIAISLPEGYEAQVRSRSGLALKNGLVVLNSPGTIDSDYRGEIGLIMMNCSKFDFTVKNGMRLAQLVVAKCERAEIEIVSSLDSTDRNEGGFGSTGI